MYKPLFKKLLMKEHQLQKNPERMYRLFKTMMSTAKKKKYSKVFFNIFIGI